jgi:hypothetical protein
MSELAFIRPDEWNLPLFVHVLGALTLIGATAFATTSLAAAWRGGSLAATRNGYRALLIGVIPAWIVMRVGAEWIADKEGYIDLDDPPAWIDIGFMTAEPVFLLVIIATVLAGLAVRRAGRAGGTDGTDTPSVGVRVAAGMTAFALAAYLVALWAMTTKPE